MWSASAAGGERVTPFVCGLPGHLGLCICSETRSHSEVLSFVTRPLALAALLITAGGAGAGAGAANRKGSRGCEVSRPHRLGRWVTGSDQTLRGIWRQRTDWTESEE